MLNNETMFEKQQISKEDYLILQAKNALATDIHAAKSWLITAKSLFPRSAKVQFEAYNIEKLSKNVKEAAKCFSEMFQNFPDDCEIWKEVETITACLRAEQNDAEGEMLCQMFQHIPEELQHRLLVMTADHSEDTMEHCKLLLLLLRRFPQTIATHGPRLVETLLTAEKHSHPGKSVNDFRRLLACEALPLLGAAPVELNARLSLRLLCKAMEFYLAYVPNSQDAQIQNPWDKLFQVVEMIGKKLGWELSSLFATPWNREIYSEKMQLYASAHAANLNEELIVRQLLICSLVILLRILHECSSSIGGENPDYCLVEAFVEQVPCMEPKVKKRKREETSGIIITSDHDFNGNNGIALSVKLWELLHSSDYLQREITKLIQQMRLETWLNTFLIDLAVYKRELPSRPPQENDNLCTVLRMASSSFFNKDYKSMLEYITIAAKTLPTVRGKISTNLTVTGMRHLHYLFLARFPILQYCSKLLLLAITENFSVPGSVGDVAIGHALVLMQIDWPKESNMLFTITEKIRSRGSFSYPLFQNYVINVDILEELTYLWTDHGGNVNLDIAVNSGILQNRRISTRGTDKGAREEVKQAMRRQAARDGVDAIDDLLQRFITNEKTALLHGINILITQ